MKDHLIYITSILLIHVAMTLNDLRPVTEAAETCFFLAESRFLTEPTPPKSIRVAGLQMDVTSDIKINAETIIQGIREAAGAKVDFLMTPEGSLSGYNNTFDAEELVSALEEVTEAAKNAKIGLLLGTCYKEGVGEDEKWVKMKRAGTKSVFTHQRVSCSWLIQKFCAAVRLKPLVQAKC